MEKGTGVVQIERIRINGSVSNQAGGKISGAEVVGDAEWCDGSK